MMPLQRSRRRKAQNYRRDLGATNKFIMTTNNRTVRTSLAVTIRDASPRVRCRDIWVEKYLEFLETLHHQSARRPASTYLVDAAVRAYGAFCLTCCPIHRRAAWQAISAACALFAQSSRHN